MSKSLAVTVTDNGPLKLSGEGIKYRFAGEQLAVDDGAEVFLCRCGQSSNAPFCDGSHSRTGFTAEPGVGETKELRVWEGKTIRTFFNPNVCMHVFYCKPLNDLRERELAGDAAAASEIARVVQSCPSGALTFEATDVEAPARDTEADVDIQAGGEVRLQCEFDINAELMERQTRDRATLCRCGLSKNKPWCDGRHKKREDFR